MDWEESEWLSILLEGSQFLLLLVAANHIVWLTRKINYSAVNTYQQFT